jgi:general secretion pathway protein J
MRHGTLQIRRAGRWRRARGMTLLEIMISLAVLSMMVVSVYSGFKGTLRGMEAAEEIQLRHSIVRNGIARMTSEISMAYLSFNRPLDDQRHYTFFEGRDSFEKDDLSFSSFAHLRVRKDSNESDQSVIQYFLQQDPKDPKRTHLYRRESRRLTGDRPEDMHQFFPAYVLIEDVEAFDLKYWDNRRIEWTDEWATMRLDMQPDRLPQRVKIKVGIRDTDGELLYFTAQTALLMQERIDLAKGG